MARYEITAPNGQKFEITAPDDATQDQVMAYAQSEFSKAQQPIDLTIPSPAADAALKAYYDSLPKAQEPTFAQKAIGAGEVGLSALTGATLGTVGQIGGTIEQAGRELLSGQFGTPEAADRIEQYAADVANVGTYSPRTQVGQEYAQKLGEVAAPFAGLAGATGQINALTQSARNAPRAIASSANEAVRGAKAFREAMNTDPLTAKSGVKLSEPILGKTQTVVKDKPYYDLVKSGVSERFASAVKDLAPTDKRKVSAMVDLVDRGDKSLWASKYERPSDIVGDSLADRVSYIKEINKKAGESVDEAARKLTAQADSDSVRQNAISRLGELDIGIGSDGKPIYKRSYIDGFATDQRVVKNVVSRIPEIKTDEDLHKLKRYIQRNVNWGRGKEGGLQPETERMLKNLSADINSQLSSKYPDYADANKTYSETIGALSDFQDAAGKTIDIFDDNAAKPLGTRVRSLLSNNQGRQNLENAIKQVDSVAKKYGAKADDDILKQIAIVDELERIYGAKASTSIGGELTKGAELGREVLNKGIYGTAADKGFSLLSKSDKQKRAESIVALRKILKGRDK